MEEFERLSKKAKGCMRVAAIVGFVVWLVISGVVFIIAREPMGVYIAKIVGIILLVTYVLNILNVIIAPEIRYLRYRYCIDEEKVDLIEGIWVITEEIAPIERIHQIEVAEGPIDRMFGLGKVIVTTAGGTITLRFIEKEKADLLAKNLQTKVRQIVRRQIDEAV